MKINIPNPCNEDWSQMKIGVRSRHCDKCEKSVVDFTQMSRQQTIVYLIENSDANVCGRINNTQIDFHFDDVPVIIETLRKKGGNASFLIMALLCMSLISCEQKKVQEEKQSKPDNIEVKMGKIVKDVDTTDKLTQTGNHRANIIPEVLPIYPPDPRPIPYPTVGEIIIDPPPPPRSAFEDSIARENEVLDFADKMPEFKGGMDSLFKFIQKNLKYPEYEKEANIQGTAYVQFAVMKNGSIEQIKIVRSVPGSHFIDKEVIRIVKLMPAWTPGEQNGKKVNVRTVIPVRFKLE